MQLSTLSKTFVRSVFNSKKPVTGQLVFRRFPAVVSPSVDDCGEVITKELEKRACPTCGTIYAIRALNFCRIDGTALPLFKS